MKKTLYFMVMVCVLLGVFFALFGSPEYITGSLLNPKNWFLQLSWGYQDTTLIPLAFPARTVPVVLATWIVHHNYLLYTQLALTLFYVQIVLWVRRAVICVRARRLQPPPHFSSVWHTVLFIATASWLCGIFLQECLPHLVMLIMTQKQAMKFMVPYVFGSSMFIHFFWLIPANLLGPVFFGLELASLTKEGVLPHPNARL